MPEIRGFGARFRLLAQGKADIGHSFTRIGQWGLGAQAAKSAQLVALAPTTDGGWDRTTVPESCPSKEATVLHYAGFGLLAEVPRIDEEWPRVTDSEHAVVVLSMSALPDAPSSKVVKAL